MTAPRPHKGILLSGGKGTRLHPLTRAVSKQLLAVFDKPMVYYPLTTLIVAGVREILVISTPHHLPRFEEVLGDGAAFGVSFEYLPQPNPRGIADALIIGEQFLGDSPSILVLGDNVIYGRYDFIRKAVRNEGDHATIFAYHVDNPSEYGVIEFDEDGRVLDLVEKPDEPRSSWAVPGLYVYPAGVAQEAHKLEPSARGELEVTDLHRRYLAQGRLEALKMGRGTAWFDTGTAEDLLAASNFIEAIQRRQGLLVGSPEEAAFRVGLIDEAGFRSRVDALPVSAYRDHLVRVVDELDWPASGRG